MFTPGQLFFTGVIYLAILFGSAYLTEKGFIPRAFAKHPATRVLSLGVFAGSIAYYGTIGIMSQSGPAYLIYFIGASAAFLIAPVLLEPIGKIALAHKLGSIADVFAFRYPAPWVGGTISLLMLLGVAPLLALQIQAVSHSVTLLNPDIPTDAIAVVFCLMISVFAILYGARHLSTRDKHEGLIVAIGLESMIKLLALGLLAWYCIREVFGGMDAMLAWADETGNLPAYQGLGQNTSRTFLLLSFAAMVAMPHVYHMLITENDDERAIKGARWGVPLYLLLFSLCIPPMYFAGTYLSAGSEPEYYPITIGMVQKDESVVILAFVACLAAASSVLIVTTIALASMIVNHVLLPLARPTQATDIYRTILRSRQAMICAVVLFAFLIYSLLGENQNLLSLGTVAFVAILQFLPGLIGGFHWRRANGRGMIAGLVAGYIVWAATLLIPLMRDLVYGFEFSAPQWHMSATLSILANVVLLIGISLATRMEPADKLAADACISNRLLHSFRGELEASSAQDVENSLAMALGRKASNREVTLALRELSFPQDENRPHALSLLRDQMETNLSSFLGQTIAHRIIENLLPLKGTAGSAHLMEAHLETYRSELTGLAAEFDKLRLYYRRVLQDLPTAVCSVDQSRTIRTWNQAMADTTGIETERAIGITLERLPAPWGETLTTFVYDQATHRLKDEIHQDEQTLWVNLHKASIADVTLQYGDLVIVLEDLTESQLMEEQLMHKERLASIGQLAAGVAHEIGNPITGIACLAQNLKLEVEDNPEVLEISREILNQTDRVSTILQSLINFAYGSKGEKKQPLVTVQVKQCVDEAINLLNLSKTESMVRFVNRCNPALLTIGDPQRLCQVFINLLSNAQDASKNGDEVLITNRLEEDTIAVEILDQGHGIPAGSDRRIFEPFFTTKDPDRGTGLGLAIVATIIEEHHGAITAERVSEIGGTRVVIKLPVSESTSESSQKVLSS